MAVLLDAVWPLRLRLSRASPITHESGHPQGEPKYAKDVNEVVNRHLQRPVGRMHGSGVSSVGDMQKPPKGGSGRKTASVIYAAFPFRTQGEHLTPLSPRCWWR